MSDKYYTPDISEFYVGFEYENKEGFLDGTVKLQEQFDNSKWIYNCVEIGDLPYIHRALYGINSTNELCGVRVKYLDKEDIESLGWKITGGKLIKNVRDEFELPFNDPRESHDKVRLIFNYSSKWCLITSGNYDILYGDWSTRFCGYIKNKSELCKLMKQLGIK